MTETEAREVLPGSGDLAEMVRLVIGDSQSPECEDFSDEQGVELLNAIVAWMEKHA
jgi:hypothetical protein